MKRYEIERAVQRAQLPGPSKAILHVLCSRIHAEAGIIPPSHQPSLNRIASLTGYSKSTVVRHLATLERAGWVTRARPPLWLSQTQHATTAYAMHPPAVYPQARRRGEPALVSRRAEARATAERELVARDDVARRAAERGLGAGGDVAGGTPDHKTEVSTEVVTEAQTEVIDRDAGAAADDDIALRVDLENAAMHELHELTGRWVSVRTAAAAVRLVLDGRTVRDPRAYLIKALREDPQRYLPKSTGPAPFRAGMRQDVDGNFTQGESCPTPK